MITQTYTNMNIQEVTLFGLVKQKVKTIKKTKLQTFQLSSM